MARVSHGKHGLPLLLVILCMGIVVSGVNSLGRSSSRTYEAGKSNKMYMHKTNICPWKKYIQPCVCKYDSSVGMDLDCSKVTSEDELRNAFTQSTHFNSTDFNRLFIKDNRNITILKEGDLGNVTFKEIHITGSALTEIDDLVMMSSRSTLSILELINNELISVPDISNYTQLSMILLAGNKLTEFPLLKSTLTLLSLENNNISQIPSNPIQELPLLQNLYLYGNPIKKIPSGSFANNEHLSYLDLGNCNLSIVPKDSIMLHGDNTELWLYNNQLTFLPHQVVSGVQWVLNVQGNQLAELPEKVYRPLLEKDADLFIEDNPFGCGCDIAWLIENQTLLYKLPGVSYGHDIPTCQAGESFTDLDPEFFKVMCHNETGGT